MAPFALPEPAQDAIHAYRRFVEETLLPREADAHFETDDTIPTPLLEEMREAAREQGLWAPHMPKEWGGQGFGALTLAHVHEELGRTPLGPLAVNAMAPDEGNMHALLRFGTEDQQERYLEPLVDAEIRSCFAMTEKDAGADPYRIQTQAERDGDDWVLNGDKWFATGADGAAFAIVVARTDPDVHPKQGTSLFIVDTDTDGFTLERQIPSMGAWAPGGHCELTLDNVRVPQETLLGEPGHGYQIAQDRLGLGRTTHAMRWIGMAQRALDRMAKRALERETFGKRLAEHQGIQWMLADSATELTLARTLVLRTAHNLEHREDARHEVSILKAFAANKVQAIVDRAIQVHGALGYSKDLLLERFFRDARAGRIYDGPDEVHKWSIAKNVLEAYKEHGSTRSAAGGWNP